MPKIQEYEDKLSEKLFELLQKADESVNVKRIQCVLLRVRDGMSPSEIAEFVGYHPNYIEQIQAKFWKEGEIIFQKKEKGGRYNENMTKKEEKVFLESLEKESKDGSFVDISRIHEAYEEKIGRKVYRSVIYDLLDRNNWRKITPRPKHEKNNKEKMEDFKKDRLSSNNQESKRRSRKAKSSFKSDVPR